MRTLKIAMLGFGNAGRAFARILLDKHQQIKQDYGCDIQTAAIVTGSRGTLLSPAGFPADAVPSQIPPESDGQDVTSQGAISQGVTSQGIDLAEAIRQIEEDGRFDENSPFFSRLTALEVVDRADYDVIIELTPLQLFTGQPATDHLRRAMKRGKHAITANKGPIAWAYDELAALAEEQKVQFYFETTVMDGTPVFNLVDETLKYCKVTEVSGILNTTTNFVLEELAKGRPYDEVMEEGRRRGFVEADPSMDMEGWDAAAKTAALLNVLMKAGITPREIDRTGISEITAADIDAAASRGCLIKLLCHGTIQNGKVIGAVRPTEVPKDDLLSHIDGTSSVVSITTDLMGKLPIVEHDPELLQTGYGIFSDLVRIISHL